MDRIFITRLNLVSCDLVNDIGIDIHQVLHFDKHIDRIVAKVLTLAYFIIATFCFLTLYSVWE